MVKPKKKVVLFSEIGRVKTFYNQTARISRMCMRIYIFCFKKTHKQKKFHWPIYLHEYTFFPLQRIKDNALCFSIKKSAVRVVF